MPVYTLNTFPPIAWKGGASWAGAWMTDDGWRPEEDGWIEGYVKPKRRWVRLKTYVPVSVPIGRPPACAPGMGGPEP